MTAYQTISFYGGRLILSVSLRKAPFAILIYVIEDEAAPRHAYTLRAGVFFTVDLGYSAAQNAYGDYCAVWYQHPPKKSALRHLRQRHFG